VIALAMLLRQGIGLQQAPPNMLIVSLAIFLTYFVMAPVFDEAWTSGIRPYLDGGITEEQAFERAMAPFRAFMEGRVAADTLEAMHAVAPQGVDFDEDGQAPLSLLIPSFLLSEIERGFEIGFMVFLPFLVIDLVVASVLMSMGVMMVPPTVVALPFKLAFFVVADGWTLLAGALVRGYAQ
jgi:flagellar biosynthetic protein FliP